mgnify:FL=1
MWISGIGQGLMSRATSSDGTLQYAFVEIVKFTYPYYLVRLLGGLLVLTGMLIMLYNMVKTLQEAKSDAASPVLPVANQHA